MNAKSKHVDPREYDRDWIKETWGWDTPEEFIRSQGRNLRPRVHYSLAIANLQPGMRILDVGCGRGEVVLYCARRGIEAVGVDFSAEVISLAEEARATHTAEQQRRMRFVCDDVKNIREKAFDRIFLLDLVEHLYDWELDQLFEVCRGLLKPEGELIIHTLPNVWVYEILYAKLFRLFLPWLPRDPRGEKEKAIHVNEMSITHLHRRLRHNRFNTRIWVNDLITRQAKWHEVGELSGKRSKLYQWMRKPFVSGLFQALCLTPLRVLIANDIFAVARHEGKSIPFRRPMRQNWTESVILSIYMRGADR